MDETLEEMHVQFINSEDYIALIKRLKEEEEHPK
jgi:hypothetical protein